ncbi:hypothetical protein V7S57_11990 [Caulobacter sp. CCNWLY153]|nr:hypothetical protein [Caulobacter radicis]
MADPAYAESGGDFALEREAKRKGVDMTAMPGAPQSTADIKQMCRP